MPPLRTLSPVECSDGKKAMSWLGLGKPRKIADLGDERDGAAPRIGRSPSPTGATGQCPRLCSICSAWRHLPRSPIVRACATSRYVSQRNDFHYSAQRSDRMWSKAENPSVARIASCRCSWPGPPAILSGRAIGRSNPPQQRTVRVLYLDTMFGKSKLSEPDSSEGT
jgi:hypothetical protein